MARRSDTLTRRNAQRTYRAIEAEEARKQEVGRRSAQQAHNVNAQPADERDPLEMAKAAGAALRGIAS